MGVLVGVKVAVGVFEGVPVGVIVKVGVFVGVLVDVNVGVGVRDGVFEGVTVDVGVCVATTQSGTESTGPSGSRVRRYSSKNFMKVIPSICRKVLPSGWAKLYLSDIASQ
ncbi:MAG: hypothetical protein HS100_17420 [Anaerolineales bacterium]|nr:hypothetical protein [Anaerolineales bacterium]